MRRVIILSYTEAGKQLNKKVTDYFVKKGDVLVSCCYGRARDFLSVDSDADGAIDGMDFMSTDELLQQEWCRTDAFVFIGAMGIAVRHVAPFLESKVHDPAVLVLDEKGQFVIPVVSGHIGGGVTLARELAAVTGGQAVITTATDVEERFAVDVFAGRNHFWIENPSSIKNVSAALLQGRTVDVWTSLPIGGEVPEGLRVLHLEGISLKDSPGWEEISAEAPEQERIWKELPMQEAGTRKTAAHAAITIGVPLWERERIYEYYGSSQVCVLKPRQYILGIGCKKGKTAEELEVFLRQICDRVKIDIHEIGAIASIDVKKEEPGIWELSRRLRAGFEVFSAGELAQVEEAVTSSVFVKETVGVDNVCERSAYCLAKRWMCEDGLTECGRQEEKYNLILGKQAQDGMTMAIVKVIPRVGW